MMGAVMRARHMVENNKDTQTWWCEQEMVQGEVGPQKSGWPKQE